MKTYPGTLARAVAVALAALLVAPLVASAAGAPAGARLLACRRAPSIDERIAVVAAWMHPLPSGSRLALRIDLWQRTPGDGWTPRSDVPGLGTWTSPSDALVGTRAGDIFKYRQAVGRLVVPSAYRFHVAFRWLDADGAVAREAAVTTHACRQPDLRPNLVLDAVDVAPAPRDGFVRYLVTVRNAGHAPAPRSLVAATLPGDETPNAGARPVGRLAPGASAVVSFNGPGCGPGAVPATFAADPGNAVEESREDDNQLAGSCPAP
jgi:hypothetical protein